MDPQTIEALAWKFLQDTPERFKNPQYEALFETEVAFKVAFENAGVTLAPGVLDVVQAHAPPHLSFFTDLPRYTNSCWAVYLVTFIKPNCRPRIYVGSGTSKWLGAIVRLRQYEAKTELPTQVTETLNDGYIIQHIGLLCTAPIPSCLDRYENRALFLVLEAVFAFSFWAMVSDTSSYNMPVLCTWDKASLEYDGLCTHSPLNEGIRGSTAGKTDDEILADEEERMRRHSVPTAYAVTHNPALLSTMGWYAMCRRNPAAYFAYKARDPEGFKATVAKHAADRLENRARTRKRELERRRAWYQKNKLTARYSCDACASTFTEWSSLDQHLKSKLHFKTLKGWKPNPKPHRCNICDCGFEAPNHLEEHYTSSKHLTKLAEDKAKGIIHPPPPPLLKKEVPHPFKCITCPDVGFTVKSSLVRHYDTKMHKANVAKDEARGIIRPPPSVEEKVPGSFVCTTCPDTTFTTERARNTHYDTKMHKENVAKDEAQGIIRPPPDDPKESFVCTTCPDTTCTSERGLKMHYKTTKHKENVAENEARGIFLPPSPPKKVVARPFKCITCPDTAYAKKSSLHTHYTSPNHMANVAKDEARGIFLPPPPAKVAGSFVCATCPGTTFTHGESLLKHYATQKHKNNVAAEAAASTN
jgi:hypothetical protein